MHVLTWEWLNYSDYVAAFIVGLMGGVHCFGMCGGIVGALSFSVPTHRPHYWKNTFPLLLSYNVGRVTSYVLAGAIVGGAGSLVVQTTSIDVLGQLLSIIAALFMIALGLYLGHFWAGIAYIEKVGQPIWRRLEPLSRRFIPINTPLKALPVGFIWGWLPCGLVYSVLIWAISANSLIKGAGIMLLFGLGTLPNLILMGTFAAQLSRWLRQKAVKYLAASVVIVMGLIMLVKAVSTMGKIVLQ